MPFSSKSQLGVCYRKAILSQGKSGWDCDAWLAETPNPQCLPYSSTSSSKAASSSKATTRCRTLLKRERVVGPVMVGARGGHYFMAGGVKVYIPKGDANLKYATRTYGVASAPKSKAKSTPKTSTPKSKSKVKSAPKSKAKSKTPKTSTTSTRRRTWVVTLMPVMFTDDAQSTTTGSPTLDRLVKSRIAADKTDIKSIPYPHKTTAYAYSPKAGVVTLKVTSKRPLTVEEMRAEMLDAIETGPDTWMEGDIRVLSQEEARKSPIFARSDSGVELNVGLIDVKPA